MLIRNPIGIVAIVMVGLLILGVAGYFIITNWVPYDSALGAGVKIQFTDGTEAVFSSDQWTPLNWIQPQAVIYEGKYVDYFDFYMYMIVKYTGEVRNWYLTVRTNVVLDTGQELVSLKWYNNTLMGDDLPNGEKKVLDSILQVYADRLDETLKSLRLEEGKYTIKVILYSATLKVSFKDDTMDTYKLEEPKELIVVSFDFLRSGIKNVSFGGGGDAILPTELVVTPISNYSIKEVS